MASILDLLKSVRGLGGGGAGGNGAGSPQQGAGAGAPNRSRSQAEQELVTWHAIKAWVAAEKLKIAREEECVQNRVSAVSLIFFTFSSFSHSIILPPHFIPND
jgi:hypothetical protein